MGKIELFFIKKIIIRQQWKEFLLYIYIPWRKSPHTLHQNRQAIHVKEYYRYLKFNYCWVYVFSALLTCTRDRVHEFLMLIKKQITLLLLLLLHKKSASKMNMKKETCFEPLSLLWNSSKSPSWNALKQLNIPSSETKWQMY